MTQLNRKKSRNFENRSTHVAEWASKRQALIEAAKAKREAKQQGEITEHHTFSPELTKRKGSRSPGSRYRSSYSEIGSPRASFSMTPRTSESSSPKIHSRETRQTFPTYERKDSAVQFDGIDEEMPSHSEYEGGGHEVWAEDQSMGTFRASVREDADFAHGACYADFRSDRDNSPSLSSLGTNSASREGLLNQSMFFLPNSMRGPTGMEDCYVDEGERKSFNVAKTSSLSSSAATTEAPLRATASMDMEIERGLSGWDFMDTAVIVSSDSHHNDPDLSSAVVQRQRRNPIEYRELGRGSNSAAECMVATMESLRDTSPTVRPPRSRFDDYIALATPAHERDNSGVQPPIPPGMAAGLSWKDVIANVPENSKSVGSRSGHRQHAGHTDCTSSRALRQQEMVLEVMRVAEHAVRYDGIISMGDLYRFLPGAHEEFLLWLAQCSNCVDAGMVNINDLGTAVGKFYLQGIQEGNLVDPRSGGADDVPDGSTKSLHSNAPPQMVCPPPLPSLGSGPLVSDESVVNVHWREAPLRREEVAPSPQSAQRDMLSPLPYQPMERVGQESQLDRSHSAEALQRMPVPQACKTASPPSANRVLLESPSIPCSDPDQEVKESLKRRRYFELRCLELEEQIENEKKAEAELRQELLTSHQAPITRQREDETPCDESHQVKTGRVHERIWPGTVARPQSHTLSSYGAVSNPRRASSLSHSGLSPVQEEPYKELMDSPPRPSADADDEVHIQGEVIHRPRERPTDSPESPTLDDPREMQKLVNMCTRLRNEDDTLPKDEIDSLHDLVKQLAHLMERRREHAEEPPTADEESEYGARNFIDVPLENISQCEDIECFEAEGDSLQISPSKGESVLDSEVDSPYLNSRIADRRCDRNVGLDEVRAAADIYCEPFCHERQDLESGLEFQAAPPDGGDREAEIQEVESAWVRLQAMEKMVPKQSPAGSIGPTRAPVVLPPVGESLSPPSIGYARFAHLTTPTHIDGLDRVSARPSHADNPAPVTAALPHTDGLEITFQSPADSTVLQAHIDGPGRLEAPASHSVNHSPYQVFPSFETQERKPLVSVAPLLH